MKLQNVTLGSDPEFGVVDSNEIPKSVVGLLGGTKRNPLDIGNGCSRQEDNVGAEVCIPPTNDRDAFVESILYAKKTCTDILQESGHDLHLINASSLRYEKEELNSQQAMEFGCEPSFCIYNENGISERPNPEDVGNIRSFGFHIHIGFDGLANIETIENIVKAMDVFCGVPSIILDSDTERRQLYGNAGDFRFKHLPHKNITIVEYRTLGGNMGRTPELMGFVFDQTMTAVNTVNNWKTVGSSIEDILFTAKECIDTGNVELATAICEQFKIKLPEHVRQDIKQTSFA